MASVENARNVGNPNKPRARVSQELIPPKLVKDPITASKVIVNRSRTTASGNKVEASPNRVVNNNPVTSNSHHARTNSRDKDNQLLRNNPDNNRRSPVREALPGKTGVRHGINTGRLILIKTTILKRDNKNKKDNQPVVFFIACIF